MATFEAQVEALTDLSLDGSSTPTRDELSQFLKDGVLDVTSRWLAAHPEDAALFQRATTTSDSQGVSVGGAQILSVIREAGADGDADGSTAWEACTEVPVELQSKVVDTESLYFASTYNPVYTLNDNRAINVYPVPSSNSGFKIYYVNEEPKDTTNGAALVYSHSDIKYFPNDKVYLVSLYAAMQCLKAAMGSYTAPTTTISGVAWDTEYPGQITSINSAFTKLKAELDETQTVCDLIKTQADSAVAQITEAATAVDAPIDIALASMRISAGKISASVELANAEFDKCDTMLSLGELDTETEINTAYTAMLAEITDIPDICDEINTSVDGARTTLNEAAVEVDVNIDVALASMRISAGKINAAVELANGQYDEAAQKAAAGDDNIDDTALENALVAINSQVDSAVNNTASINGALVSASERIKTANAAINSANTEAAEIATQTDSGDGASDFPTALGEIVKEIGKADELILLAKDEYDEASTQVSGSKASPITDASNEFKKSNALLASGESDTLADIDTALTAMKTELDETQSVCDDVHSKIGLASTEVGKAMDEAVELASKTDNESDFDIASNAIRDELALINTSLASANTEYNKISAAIGRGNTQFGASSDILNLGEEDSENDVNTAKGKITAELDETQVVCDNMHTEIALAKGETAFALAEIAQAITLVDLGNSDIKTALTAMNTAIDKFRADGDAPALFGDAGEYEAGEGLAHVKDALENAQKIIDDGENSPTGAAAGDAASYLYTDQDIELMNGAISIATSEISRANTHIAEWNAASDTLVKEINAFASEATTRYGWINAKSVIWQGKLSAAQGYMGTAGGYANEIQTKIAIANGYIAEINIRLAQATTKRQESQARLTAGSAYLQEANTIAANGNAYIQEANTRMAKAQAYGAEVSARTSFAGAKSQAIQGHVNVAQAYVAAAQGFGNEVQAKVNIANGYAAEINTRLAQARAKREESQARLAAGGAFLQEAQATISAGDAFLRQAQASISQGQGYVAEVGARSTFTGAKSQAVQAYINTANAYMAEAAQDLALAASYGNASQAHLTSAQGYSAEIQAYRAGIQVYAEASQNRINVGNAFLAEANAYAGEVSAHSNEVSARMAQIGGYGQISSGYISAASGYAQEITSRITAAQGFAAETQVKLAQAQAKREESASRIAVGNAYLAEANTKAGEVAGHANEVSARVAQVGGYSQISNTLLSAASQYAQEVTTKIAVAQGYSSEIESRLSFVPHRVSEYQALLQEQTIQMQQYLTAHDQLKLQYESAFAVPRTEAE